MCAPASRAACRASDSAACVEEVALKLPQIPTMLGGFIVWQLSPLAALAQRTRQGTRPAFWPSAFALSNSLSMNQSRALFRSFGLLLALLLLLVGVSLFNFRLLRQASADSTRSYQTLLESEALLQSLLNMETGVRGFLVTGEEPFLEPYRSGQLDFQTHFQSASELLRASPTQSQSLGELGRLEERWIGAMMEPVIARRRGARSLEAGLEAATVRANERKSAMDAMRGVIARIETRENTRLQARAAQVARRQRRMELILWTGGVFSILLTGLLASFAARAARQIRAAAAQLELSHAQLETSNAQLQLAKDAAEADNARRRAAEEQLREAVEDLERSNAELEQFAYVASHDLQEPLRAVAGCVQVLQKRYGGQLDARADQFIEHAVSGAQRMQNLINDLLAYSRVGTHGKAFALVSMERIADRALLNLSERIRETGVEVTRDALPEVWGDGGQLELVLQNLVSNALKFRGEVEPQVHIGYQLQTGETPRGETPRGETPRGETPRGETPRGETPRGETPRGETPRGKTPRGETPRGETPRGETPRGETPRGETPRGETPRGETPRGETPRGETPRGETPQHVFSVRDNGLGIEAQYFERIFVMFQRLHTRADFPGTGIGLAICKKIVERHDGQIGVESVPGAGATFWFSIPVHAPSQSTKMAREIVTI